jgi:hypothetical protein
MARATKRRQGRAYTTTEARNSLPTLVKQAATKKKAGRSLRSSAIEIQPRGEERKAFLIPEVDLEAAERELAELRELLEDIELMQIIEERVTAAGEKGKPLADVIRDFGHEDLIPDTSS